MRLASEAGPGNSNYQDYDDRITAAAVDWLKARAAQSKRKNGAGKPWVLFVSLVCPHFPLIARPEWYDRYSEDAVPLPALYGAAERVLGEKKYAVEYAELFHYIGPDADPVEEFVRKNAKPR